MKDLSLRLGCVLAASLFAVACSSDDNNGGGGGNVVNVDPSMSESAIASAFSGAAADSTIQMAAGTYHFTNSLNLATKNNITVKGAGDQHHHPRLLRARLPAPTAWCRASLPDRP